MRLATQPPTRPSFVVFASKNECAHRHRRKLRQNIIDCESETDIMLRQVIEFGGLPVGIAIPDEGQLRFIAVKFHVIDLDNKRFATAGELRAAIGRHLRSAEALAA
jgi:hypothetical protein